MDDAEERPEAQLPVRRITVNQLVSYNLGYFRRAAGRTQEDIGQSLGWTNVAVSAAERGWDGKRVRQFDADLLAALAAALEIPVEALFLAPADDGIEYSYRLLIPGVRDGLTMRQWHLLGEDPERETEPAAFREFARRLGEAYSRYVQPGAGDDLADRARELAGEQELAGELREVLANRKALTKFHYALNSVIGDSVFLERIIRTALESTEGGRTLAAEVTAAASASVPGEPRTLQEQLVTIGREMFGDLGPSGRDQLASVLTEAHRRGINTDQSVYYEIGPDGWHLVAPPQPSGRHWWPFDAEQRE